MLDQTEVYMRIINREKGFTHARKTDYQRTFRVRFEFWLQDFLIMGSVIVYFLREKSWIAIGITTYVPWFETQLCHREI